VSLLPKVKDLARQRGVTIKNHNVIYKLVDDIKEEITKRLPTKQVEESLGLVLKISECSL
jgi:translation initiation factor IF-2